MKSRSAWRAWLAALVAAGCAVAAPPQQPPAPAEAARPALWRAEAPAGGGTLYLFGSVHVGDERTAGFGQAVEEAYTGADELVVEIALSELDPAHVAEVIARHGSLSPPDSLEQRLSPETWAAVRARCAELGLPLEAVQRMQPWLLALTLTGHLFSAAGLDFEQGVDARLDARASGADAAEARPVVGLETLESQSAAMAALPAAVQEKLLRDAVDPGADPLLDPSALVDAWRRGDDEAVARFLETDSEEDRLFFEYMIYRRNEQMTERLREMDGDGRSRLVVVGLLHMIGERGIPALLARSGYRVERVD